MSDFQVREQQFGDIDPEDEWDAGDPIAEKLDIIRRAIISIREVVDDDMPHDARRERFRKRDLLDHIIALLDDPETVLEDRTVLQGFADQLNGIDP